MKSFQQVIDTVRERLYRFCDPEYCGELRSITEKENLFVYSFFIKTPKNEVKFLNFEEVWEPLLEVAETNTQLKTINGILGTGVFSIGGCVIEVTRNPETGVVTGETGTELSFLPKVDPLALPEPILHNYSDEKFYAWDGFVGKDRPLIPGYEIDFILYKILTVPLTFNTFMDELVDGISKTCGYTDKERYQFKKEMLKIHTCIIQSKKSHD